MLEEMKLLIQELHQYIDAYYNKNISLISDYEYDKKFNHLLELEDKTGIVLSDSPTINVGASVVSELNKVEHNHSMLSLNKTKNIAEVDSFISSEHSFAMHKLDGLTISLRYMDGDLVSAETRGNGYIGEDVLHTVKRVINIPHKIPFKEELIVDGEAIVTNENFMKANEELSIEARKEGINKRLSGEALDAYIDDRKFSNARGLASGSLRQLNGEITYKRKIKFIAWKCIKGCQSNSFIEQLEYLKTLGFDVVDYIDLKDSYNINDAIDALKAAAVSKGYPIDGLVFSYDDIEYGNSLGATSHHPKSQLAFKFYDEEQETVLKEVEWSLGRTGVITPIAIFEPVCIDGTEIERASLHNVSNLKKYSLKRGDHISVYKANMIIPQIAENLDKGQYFEREAIMPPDRCPICKGKTKVLKDNETEILICDFPDCEGKLINKMSNFVSKSCMDIRGLSKKTIEKLITVGIINDFADIYVLKDKKQLLLSLDGFGKKKVDGLLEEIEKSREVTLERFLCALGIKNLGSSKCKMVSRYFNGSYEELLKALKEGFDFSKIEDFGPIINKAFYDYWRKNNIRIETLASFMKWEHKEGDSGLEGMTFVITGKLNTISRESLKNLIEQKGGKLSGSISKSTTCLINNDSKSGSSKNQAAHLLEIPIVNEIEFIKTFINNKITY